MHMPVHESIVYSEYTIYNESMCTINVHADGMPATGAGIH